MGDWDVTRDAVASALDTTTWEQFCEDHKLNMMATFGEAMEALDEMCCCYGHYAMEWHELAAAVWKVHPEKIRGQGE